MNYELFINIIGEHMQLPENKYKSLRDNYNALYNHIDNHHTLSSDEGSVYTQGSFAIDTAIQPLKGGEIDVDMVIEFATDWYPGIKVNPFYQELEKVFKESARYQDKIELYKNVVRINYVGDYHFDIMPALKNRSDPWGKIKCVDTKKSSWIDRAPKPYKNWFADQAQDRKNRFTYKPENFQIFREMSHEELEKPNPHHIKSPLIRAIQLVKRARDSFFRNETDYVPQSIVLTTMMAEMYKGQTETYEFLFDVIHDFRKKVESNKKFEVQNPVEFINEEFTDKWKEHPKYYDNFKRFVLWLHYRLSNVLSTDNEKHFYFHLDKLFGPSVQNHIVKHRDGFMTRSFMKNAKRLSQDTLIDKQFKIDLVYPIEIIMTFTNRHRSTKRYTKHDRRDALHVGGTLKFEIKTTDHIPKQVQYHWKVRNRVQNNENCEVRGELQNSLSIDETTNFYGPHFVECFLTSNKKVIAYDRIDVSINF